MKWMRERDALIAQTMAFVQSVSRSPVEPEGTANRFRPSPVTDAVAIESIGAGQASAPRELPRLPREVPLSRPLAGVDMQTEIRQRIAAFRAHQERFNRERAEYFSATLTRLRSEREALGPASASQADKARNSGG